MPGFADRSRSAEIAALADWIYTPGAPAPGWSDADIRASRGRTAAPGKLPAKPGVAKVPTR
jgi:mono/diheme cytochrome c family protein